MIQQYSTNFKLSPVTKKIRINPLGISCATYQQVRGCHTNCATNVTLHTRLHVHLI